MAETGNFQLKQWESSDRIQMEDFNADNAKTDQALAQQRDDLVALTAAAALYGNCKIVYGSYKGTGGYGSSNRNTLTFTHKPVFLAIIPNISGGNPQRLFAVQGCNSAFSMPSSGASTLIFAWGAKSISWYSASSAAYQFNNSGTTYYYMALLAQDE